PKLEITILPRSEQVTTEFDLKVKEDANSAEDIAIEGSFSEFEFSQTETFSSSGEEFSSDKGKARGKVMIYNNYSSKDQPLVATTRVLSEDGKLFRLTERVTVPGMEDEEPGVVEAKVMADEPGDEYNINPTSFTIEGFKGGPKYEKFEVKSEDKMQGGKDNVENQKVKVVTEGDIEKARKETVERLKNSLNKKIENKIGSDMTFLENSMEKEITDSSSNYQAGDVADNFKYTVKEKVKLAYFPEGDLEKQIRENLNKEAEKGLALKKINEIEYLKDIVDFEEKEMDLTISVQGLFQHKINEDEIKEDLHKSKQGEIKQYLTEMPELEKAAISYDPDWLRSFSVRSENILIKEGSEQDLEK
ncbi:MAG: hypothetical protein R6V40_01130, partial [Candidatus Moraniibacteriota bacterium]